MSLRIKLALLIAALFIAVAIAILLIFPPRFEHIAERWAEQRAVGISNVLAAAVAPGLEFEQQTAVVDMLAGLATAQGSLYGVVRRSDGSVFAAYQGEHAPNLHGLLAPYAPLYVEKSNKALHLVTRIKGEAGTDGTLAVGFSLDDVESEKARNRTLMLAVFVLVMFGGVSLAFAFGGLLARPITALTQATTRIVHTSDLSQTLSVASNDEVGALADSFRQMVSWLRAILTGLKGLGDSLAVTTSHINSVGTSVTDGSSSISALLHESSGSMENLRESLQQTASSIHVLLQTAGVGSQSIQQMARANEQVTTNISAMASSTRVTTAAIDRLTGSIQDTARKIVELNTTLTETSASMREIDESITKVEVAASQTAELAKQSSSDAESASETLNKTIAGIERIRIAAHTTSEVVAALEQSVSEIDNVLTVIKAVVEQTSLLSLNASIIAAQAGEQGQGFGVVAGEIKSLAERTRASTGEIAQLIANVQTESRRAVEAMNHGMQSVEEGVALGHEAHSALTKILGSANESTRMMQTIAKATLEQAQGTKRVSAAIQRIAKTTFDISNSSSKQAEDSEEILNNTRRMNQLAQQVQASSDAQTRDSKEVIGAIEKITKMVTRVEEAQTQQEQASDVVIKAARSIRDVSDQQNASVQQLSSVLNILTQRADELRREMQRFKS